MELRPRRSSFVTTSVVALEPIEQLHEARTLFDRGTV
jgi:hypothetical protein